MVEALIEKGADVNQADIWGGTPLLSASYLGHTAIVRLLLLDLRTEKDRNVFISDLQQVEVPQDFFKRKDRKDISKKFQEPFPTVSKRKVRERSSDNLSLGEKGRKLFLRGLGW